jgi:hypothetical protein
MEKLQITQQELDQLHFIQQSRKQTIHELGQIELEKSNLDFRKDQAIRHIQELDVESQTLSQFLEQKYGKCSIDLSTGEITQLD